MRCCRAERDGSRIFLELGLGRRFLLSFLLVHHQRRHKLIHHPFMTVFSGYLLEKILLSIDLSKAEHQTAMTETRSWASTTLWCPRSFPENRFTETLLPLGGESKQQPCPV